MGGRLQLIKTQKLNAFARQGMLVFAAQMAVNISNFLFHAVVSRRIGVEEYGALNALVSAFNIFAVVAVVLGAVVAKIVAELRTVDALGRIRGLTFRAGAILCGAAAFVMLVSWLFAPNVASYLHVSAVAAVIITGGILAVNFMLPLRGVLQGAEMFVPYSISLVLEAVLKVVLAVAFVMAGLGLAGALGGWLAGAGIALTYTLVAIMGRFSHVAASAYRLDYARIRAATAGTIVAGLLLAVMQFSDVIIVKHFLDPERAGLYAAAALAGRMLFLLVNFVPIILLPHAVRAAHDGTNPERVLFKSLGVVVAISLAGLLLYALWPALIVGALAGTAFRGAAPLLFPYAIAAMTFAVLNTVVTYRIAIHRMQFVPRLALVALLEICGMLALHASELKVVGVLIAGNGVGIVACLYGIRVSSR